MTPDVVIAADPAETLAILEDPAYRVPPAPAATAPLARLRALASRFVDGPVHADRRARQEALLAGLDPATLAAAARRLAAERLGAAGSSASAVARHVPVAVLAGALGFAHPADLPIVVARVAGAYRDGVATPDADAAATELLRASPGHDEPERALRVQLLVQAYAATATLIESLLRAGASDRATTRRLLLHDPPVASTRRVGPGGKGVAVPLAGPAARRTPTGTLAFGAGAHACPGQEHAVAIAVAVAGVLSTTGGSVR
ncbi:putative cytochrome P450 [Beutenbergia cavernae DSM 12333]|uniref:Putative cytochrome P450 n=1 Tax=Beutenbergia cavernae (strain ATCC BAA-8 / DSM 12333 / CCUG 43141 / JCM 11478 / NBRC 16432 / NCIMB 13614 / HKI 0122) TaxID=471853 RepID=C5C5T7_BEUC1|nr:hypothetical protein [Beutenbergia cavernae]ACQ80278.1 putative cytochrome P450 [Beutenbergia cavernae DSM 12333]